MNESDLLHEKPEPPRLARAALSVMTKRTTWLLGCLACLGCTQEVDIIDPPLQEAAVVTSAQLDERCEELCATGPGCGLWRGFCETQCESVRAPGCEAESMAVLDCLLDAPDESCGLDSPSCAGEMSALLECDHWSCERAACILEPATCSCSGLCVDDVYEQDCVEQPDGSGLCHCLLRGEVMRTCEYDVAACSLSCCTAVPL